MKIDEAIQELRRRNHPPPLPVRLPTPGEVETAEQRLGVQFHPDFLRYLMEASDISYSIFEPVTITRAESHTDLLRVAEKAWGRFDVPRDLLPICEHNADFYCMNPAGEIVFYSHNGWPSTKWPSLADWIEDVWLEDFA
ncbi:SMI1/KNR4 family protein [Singulisphaera sp. Ch08]|uniref:SMI1/KNR4 family protein n=1 Tax=Singulisphaera sp. Ch08 TaxID=3120278 RepID=A0AAU7CQQ1_9BACT